MTEYFLAKDLTTLFKEVMEKMENNNEAFESILEDKINSYKSSCFP